MLQLLCKEKWKFTNQMSYVPNSRPLRGQEAKQTCSLPWHLQANELPYAERTQRKTNVQAHSRVLCMHSLTTVSHSEVHSETTWQHRDAKVSRGYGKFRKSLNEICSCSKNVLWVNLTIAEARYAIHLITCHLYIFICITFRVRRLSGMYM